MKKLSYLYTMFLILSCETVVDIEIPLEPASIVINSTLVDNQFIKVNLTESQHILDNSQYLNIEGATVEIYENEKLLITLPDSLEGNYISTTHKPIRGKTYQIKVNKIGFETATSEVLLPLDTVAILDVKVDTVEVNDFGYISNYLRFIIDFNDDGRINNYYEILMINEYYEYLYDYNTYPNPPVLIDSVYRIDQIYLEYTDPTLEEFQTFGNSVVFNDELFNGNSYSMSLLFYQNQYWPNDIIYHSPFQFYIIMNNTSESYYQYQLSSQLQEWTTGDPFAQPVTVYNNIENGFGVFGAYNTAVVKVE